MYNISSEIESVIEIQKKDGAVMRAMDKVIGYQNVKEELYRIVDVIKNPNKYQKLGVTNRRG